MRPRILLIATAAVLSAAVPSSMLAQESGIPRLVGDAKAGRDTFVQVGCYQCHGYSGQGGEVAPMLTPGLRPLAAFSHIVRNPLNVMPRYSATVLSDQEVADIHAYLATIKPPPNPADIPMLRGTPASGGARAGR